MVFPNWVIVFPDVFFGVAGDALFAVLPYFKAALNFIVGVLVEKCAMVWRNMKKLDELQSGQMSNFLMLPNMQTEMKQLDV